jgi:hypothetical protein
VDRQPPRATSNEIDLYLRTIYSLLRSSGEVLVRAFEEAHMYSRSSLHAGARDPEVDVAAFAYGAARLPACMPKVRRVVMGQSDAQFRAAGFDVEHWTKVTTRGRRRPLRWDGGEVLAAYVTSVSDIDDLVPTLTAYQIEWNKMHLRLSAHGSAPVGVDALGQALQLDEHDRQMLVSALGNPLADAVEALATSESDRSVRLLSGSFVEYQRTAQRWWKGIAAITVDDAATQAPVYFVSSNTHSLANLLGGYAHVHREQLLDFARERNPEGLAAVVDEVVARADPAELANLSYYLLRLYMHDEQGTTEQRRAQVQAFDHQSGLTTIANPGDVDVGAQLIRIRDLQPARLDPRIEPAHAERLAKSEAVIINIDYPLGMAAYHHLSRLAQGMGEIRGIYLMGKAATLNAKVGDVMISTVAYDEHSQNTFLFRNCFSTADLQPLVRATVLDNQKALTVRGSFLQNREYMGVFYQEGYTVLEMETGPYLSAVYEMVYARRHPKDEIVHLSNLVPFDLGVLHYASDTPYSRRQSLLSKSMSYFGVDSTYGCTLAIARRILRIEAERLG